MKSTRKMEVSELTDNCERWQQQTAESLDDLADETDTQQKTLDKAKLSFATTGAAGGIMLIVGFCLIPFTAGASAGLVQAGVGFGALSFAGNVVSTIVDTVVNSKAMKRAQKQLNLGAEISEKIKIKLPELMAMLRESDKAVLRENIEGCRDINNEVNAFLNQVLEELDNSEISLMYSVSDQVCDIIRLSKLLSKYLGATKVLTGMGTEATGHSVNTTNVVDVAGKAFSVGRAAQKVGRALGTSPNGVDAVCNAVNAGRAAETAANVGVDVAGKAVNIGRFLETATDGLDVACNAVNVGIAAGTAADVGVNVAARAVNVGRFLDTAADGVDVAGKAFNVGRFLDTAANGVDVAGKAVHVGTFLETAADGVDVGSKAVNIGRFLETAADSVDVAGKAVNVGRFLETAADGVDVAGKAVHVGRFLETAADGVDVAGKAFNVGRFFETAADGVDVAGKAVNVGRFLETAADGVDAAGKAVNVGRAAGTAADVGVDVAKNAGKTGLKGVKAFGVALAGVGLAIDLGSIVYYGIKLYKQDPCKLAKKFRRAADCLK